VSSRKLLITTLEGLASGHSSKEAAKLIGISCEAVRSRRIKLYKTFKVNNASAAVAHGFREHILVPQRTAATTVKFLTPQEITVLQLFADGESRRSAAEKMHLSPLTVKSHLGNATKRCKAKNATHLVALAFHNELIS
jgi:DNA-binding NarL/FixJ family response regulator